MDEDKFWELARRLNVVEHHKSAGVIRPWQLRKFVDIIERTELGLKHFRATQSCGLDFAATIAPPTTRTPYYESNRSMTYCGPYTVAKYFGGDYQLERVESEAGWLTSRSHAEGIELRFVARTSASFAIAALNDVVRGIAEVAAARVILSSDGMLTFVFPIPIDR
jgi:hypothetical protein